jgi:hypothetical protein
MCEIGGQYLPAFALWKPFIEHLPALCVASHDGDKVQQHMCINFCFRLGKSGAETYEMLQAAFGESCQSQSKTVERYSVSKVDADPLKTTPAQAGRPPPTPRRLWHVCEKSFALTDI